MSDLQETDQNEVISKNDSTKQENFEKVLANFREEWQKELTAKLNGIAIPTNNVDQEEQAKKFYMEGSKLERNGELYEAIQFYKRAVQLVPDIEFKMCEKNKYLQQDEQLDPEDAVTNVLSTEYKKLIEDDENYLTDGCDLVANFQQKLGRMQLLCLTKFEQTEMHISQLPIEVLIYVMKWVVSSELDLRSLEMLSQVCRGFYVLARDPELWRLACGRAFGGGVANSPTTGVATPPSPYATWRQMYVERARLNYNGCYISKTTYIRSGENSFQDHCYRPWHIVVYYRYLRFFANGVALMMTTPEAPSQCVAMLRQYRGCGVSAPILSGRYRLKDDLVSIVMQLPNAQTTTASKTLLASNRRNNNNNNNNYNKSHSKEQKFQLELRITSGNSRKRKHVKLVWTQFVLVTSSLEERGVQEETMCTFDLTNTNKFPPLFFSRVKSYTSSADSPLQ